MPNVVCMGELLIDFVATESNRGLSEVSKFQGAPGGAPANVAVALQRLGLTTAFVGKVGNDPFGVKLRKALEKEGVDTSSLFVDDSAAGTRTTINFVSVWDDGHKDLCFYRGADRLLCPSDITAQLFDDSEAQAFHYGSISFIDEPSAGAQCKALIMARDKGLMISYDPNYRPTLWPDEPTAHRIIYNGFQYAHLAKVSEEEWKVATGHDDLQEGMQALLAKGIEVVVVSRGSRGALATNGAHTVESPALQDIRAVETTGAGDGFMAALICRLLPEFAKRRSLKGIEKETLQDALDYANAVGGLTCTKPGAIPALPSADEVNHFLQLHSRKI